MPAFNTAVNGLHMQQQTIDAIANNIANTNTVAFKSGVVHLEDSFYQTLRASSPGQPVGVAMGTGGDVSAIHMNETQGSFERTGGTTDIAIGGDGFFVMGKFDATGAQTGTFFSRAGDFALDHAGNLVNSAGFHVMGIMGDQNSQTGDATDPGVNPPGALPVSINIPETFVSQAAATTATGNIVAGDVAPTAGDTIVINGITLTFGAGATAGLNIQIPAVYTAHAQAVEIANSININTATTLITATVPPAGSSVIALTANTSGSAANAITLTTTPAQSTNPATVLIRNNTMAGGSDIGPLRQEGVQSFSVADDGAINLFGSFGTTRVIGYVLLTKFNDPSALQRVGNNLFAFSTGAGTFSGGNSFSMTADTRKANTNGLGSLQGNALELSNVDLSQQFTDMITTQRAFEANARVITTGDEMLQTVVNLRR